MLQPRRPRDFLNHEKHLRRTVQLSDIPLLLTYVFQSILEFFDLFYSKTDKSELRGVCAVFGYATESTNLECIRSVRLLYLIISV